MAAKIGLQSSASSQKQSYGTDAYSIGNVALSSTTVLPNIHDRTARLRLTLQAFGR